MLEMWVCSDFLRLEYRAEAAVRALAQLDPECAVLPGEERFQIPAQGFLLCGIQAEPTRPFASLTGLAKAHPKLGFQSSQGHIAAVAGAVDAVVGHATAEQSAVRPGLFLAGALRGVLQSAEQANPIGHGYIDVLAFSRALLVPECGEHSGYGRLRTTGNIGELKAGQDALALRPTLLLALALKDADQEQRRTLQNTLNGGSSHLSEEERIDTMRNIFESCGVFDKAETLVDRSRERAETIVAEIEDERIQALLRFFIETVLARDEGPTPAEHLDPDSPDAPPRPAPVFVPLSLGGLL